METNYDEIVDSPSKCSYIGSYYQPPDSMQTVSRQLFAPQYSSAAYQSSSRRLSFTTPNIDSQGVVDALKILQEKIRRLELERTQTQKNYVQFSSQSQDVLNSTTTQNQPATAQQANITVRQELDSKLQSAESRCKVLEKQLDYMKKMVETAKKEHEHVLEKQTSTLTQQTTSRDHPNGQAKLERLESVCRRLNRTQNIAEMKIALLERKLLKEVHERKLVQEKAEELQRALDLSLQLSLSNKRGTISRKKSKKKSTSPKLCEQEIDSPKQKIPFVAGMSTSPSHSIHANVQSILHMMKHHQPKLCEQVSEKLACEFKTRKSLQKDFITSPKTSPKSDVLSMDQSLSLLSDLLLALQDELGQMSFEQQDLEQQIASVQNLEAKKKLLKELDKLFVRMGEKEIQILKLRKHMQMVESLTLVASQEERDRIRRPKGKRSPPVSPVKAKRKSRKDPIVPKTLPLLRETQKLRNCLQQHDISWET